MQDYPRQSQIVDALVAVARDAGMKSPMTHPEDIMTQMVAAMEAGSEMIVALAKRNLLNTEA